MTRHLCRHAILPCMRPRLRLHTHTHTHTVRGWGFSSCVDSGINMKHSSLVLLKDVHQLLKSLTVILWWYFLCNQWGSALHLFTWDRGGWEKFISGLSPTILKNIFHAKFISSTILFYMLSHHRRDVAYTLKWSYLIKDIPHIGFWLSKPHSEQLWTLDRDEVSLTLIGDSLG